MTAKSFIIGKLRQWSDRFGKERFSYGYRSVSNTHVIEVLPLVFFQKNKEYLDEEYLLETDFYEKFPEEEILFVSSDSLIQLDCPEQTFGSLLFSFESTRDANQQNIKTPGVEVSYSTNIFHLANAA